MTAPAIDLDRLVKLRLLVARFGEMDLARWWNTKGQISLQTDAVFAAWDFERSKRENLDRLRHEDFIGASSDGK